MARTSTFVLGVACVAMLNMLNQASASDAIRKSCEGENVTVKIFASRDSEGRQWAPDYIHEATAAQEIIRKLWGAFHHQQALYAVIVNLHDPNADMVIMTERGLGIVELEHYFGNISIGSDGNWYADSMRVRSAPDANR